jgi:hypothetical protein
MTVAAAADELKGTLKKKSGSATTNWSHDDASAPGAGDGILLLEAPSLDRMIDKLTDAAMGGETAQFDQLNGGVRAEFDLRQELRYDDGAGHLPFALALGTSGGTPSTPSPVTGSTTRDQDFTPALNINGLVATFGLGPTASHGTDQPSAHVCPSAMCFGFTMTGEGSGIVEITSRWYGIDVFKVPAPTDDPLAAGITLNATRANIAAATLSSASQRVRMGDLDVFVDDIDGGDDFAGGSGQDYILRASRFELSFERALDWPTYGSQAANAADAVSRPLMPVNQAQQIVPTLTLMFPRWENDNLQAAFATNVPKRIRLKFTGDEIESGYNREFQIDAPHAVPQTHSYDRGDNPEETIAFSLHQAASTPTGFSSADYLRFDLRNEQASDILA